jgi:hypothetical protein
MWGSGDFIVKQRLQNLIFPEGVIYEFENNTYRTIKVNSVFTSTLSLARFYEEQNYQSSFLFDYNSGLVVPPRIELGSKV